MKKIYIIIIIVLFLLFFSIIIKSNLKSENYNIENNTQAEAHKEELEQLKELFEKYSIVKIYIKKEALITDTDTLFNKIKELKYFKNVNFVTSIDAYQKMIEQFGEDSDLVKDVDKYSLPESIWAECYYLDDISLLDEDAYFEKIKEDIYKMDEKQIIDDISTAGIIDIYNKGGMEAVDEYIDKIRE